MSFDDRMLHTLVIERPNPGAVNAYNDPISAYAVVATVPGLVQPKNVSEMLQLNQAGAVVSTHTIYTRPSGITAADRIRVDAGPMAGTYEIDGVRNAAGIGHHLEIDARAVTV